MWPLRSPALYAKAMLTRGLPEWLLEPLVRRRYVGVVRSFASAEASVLGQLVEPGDHVVDVGANVGWFTRVLAEAVGGSGHVYSVEPIPRTFRFLQHSVRTLGLANVTLFNCAASDHAGTAVMEVPREGGGDNFYQAAIVSTAAPGRRRRRYEVPLTTLDTLLAKVPQRIAVIKCDVEGHERATLAGAGGLLRRFHPALFVEVGGDPDDEASTAGDLVRWLGREGYAMYWLRGSELVRRVRGDHSVNYFFLTASHLERLRRLGTLVEPQPRPAPGRAERGA